MLRHVLPVWLALVMSILMIATLAYQQAAHTLQHNLANDLRAMAALKAGHIEHWLGERRDEAAWLNSPHLSDIIGRWLQEGAPRQGASYQLLLEHFQPRQPLHQQRRYRLRSPQDGRLIQELPSATNSPTSPDSPSLPSLTTLPPDRASSQALAMQAARSGEIQFDDLHHIGDDPRQPIVFGFFIPIQARQGNEVLTVLQLSLSPDDFLYPLLTRWPGSSDTGETLVARRDGAAILYLSPLRHAPDAPLRLRRSQSPGSRLGASQVLHHGANFHVGHDYRGVPSYSYGQPVAGTPWLLGAKIAIAEAMQPLHFTACITGSLLALTMLFVGWWLYGRRLAEHRLQAAWHEAEDLYQHAPCGYHSLDAAGRIQRINDTELRMLGYRREELIGRPIVELLPAHLRAPFLERFPKFVTEQRQVEQHQLEFRHKDGHYLPVAVSATAVRDQDGRYISSRTVVRDLSNEVTLQAQRQLLQRAIEASFDGFVIAQPDAAGLWRFVYCNPAFERMTGYSAAEIIGSTPEFLHAQEPDQIELQRLAQAVAAGQPYQGVVRNFRKDGTPFWNHVLLDPIHDTSGRLSHYVSIQEDVSSARQTQQHLDEKREQLRSLAQHHSQLLEAERQRIARELHDGLGQQLTALKMHINLLQMHYDVVPGLFEQADDMLQIASDMRTTIRQAISQLRPAALDLGIISALEWLAEHHSQLSGIDCHYRGLTEEPPIDDAIATALLRIAQESVNNATRHARPRHIELHLYWCPLATPGATATEQAAEPAAAPTSTEAAGTTPRQLCLAIRDDGCGFDPRHAGDGTHFGLLGMQERALAIGATLTMDSAPGRGSSIMIQVPLPLSPSDHTPVHTSATQSP